MISIKWDPLLRKQADEWIGILTKIRQLMGEAFNTKELEVITEAKAMIESYQLNIPETQSLLELFEMVDHIVKEGAVALNVFEKS